jgi:ferrous iron transport protein B
MRQLYKPTKEDCQGGWRRRRRLRHCHNQGIQTMAPSDARRIVLAGNPNAGKSVFFNYLTGIYVDVSNYPGTTLEISSGRFGKDLIIDTPGVYGLSSYNEEEQIAREIITGADMVINVVDAVHLERDLFLTQQIIDAGIPLLVALNMMDEAQARGLAIDTEKLAGMLGVPVIPTVATKGRGLPEVARSLANAVSGNSISGLAAELRQLQEQKIPRSDALLILEGDAATADKHGVAPGNRQEELYHRRSERVSKIATAVVKGRKMPRSSAARLGNWMLHPVFGWVFLIAVLWSLFQFIGVFVAGTVVGVTEKTIMAGWYEPWVRGLLGRFFTSGSPLGNILVGEFGLLTMTVTYLLGLLLPLVIAFYLWLSLLEDSGYLPRLATLVDRGMNALGLNGRAVIPIILGFGCVTVAAVTTRLLGSEREKRIAIFLLGLAIPCSAQLGVIAGLLAKVGPAYMTLYGLVILSVLVLTGSLLKNLLPGRTTDLLIDLPSLRLPQPRNVLRKTFVKSTAFLIEAVPLFALGSLIISLLQLSGGLTALQHMLQPLTTGWLGLPAGASTAFIMGVVRRDFGAAGLSSMNLDPFQTVVALVTITLFVPCIASVLVIFKERSKREALIMWLSTWVIAFVIGGITNQFGRIFHGNSLLIMAAFICGSATIIIFIKLGKRLSLRT